MSETERIVALAKERNEFATLEDGYVYYFPADGATAGCLSAHDLRAIADELDRRNAEWDAVVAAQLRGEGQP